MLVSLLFWSLGILIGECQANDGIDFRQTPKVDIYDCRLANIVQAYTFMSNEYRTFPAHFAIHSCKAIDANVMGVLSGIKRCRNFTGCPFLKGVKYHLCNWYPDQSKLPPGIPNGEYKVEVQVLLDYSQELYVFSMLGTVFRPIV